ncbi:MAG: type II toxin-antitoxin system RelE/ParE family toxin [Alphaproteobacteria bacterium]|nr:type II toxin-antitoxin system RelE/ParE family toxin [Alphaproteobacteria bacterium]
MLKTFKHKGLSELWAGGKTARISRQLRTRILQRLQVLDVITSPEQANVPGFNFHRLHGFDPARFTVHVNGPWCITFEMDGEDVTGVDLEQYH